MALWVGGVGDVFWWCGWVVISDNVFSLPSTTSQKCGDSGTLRHGSQVLLFNLNRYCFNKYCTNTQRWIYTYFTSLAQNELTNLSVKESLYSLFRKWRYVDP